MQRSTIGLLILAIGFPLGASAQQGATPKNPQKEKAETTVKETGVLETTMGTFEIELYRTDAPKTVDNFVRLAEKKFFDGTRVHRVVPGFVIQMGDEKSKDLKRMAEWGTGGQSASGKPFEDELNPGTRSYRAGYMKGVVAMANPGIPNGNTSQFFVMLENNPGMPKNYTIFGKVVKGMDVVEKIGKVEIIPVRSPGDGRPAQDVVIKKVTIHRDGAPAGGHK
jgi:peptidyl-prolyl cis-trans isomerase A (cyclophilin A)